MKKIKIIGSTLDAFAGSKGIFVKNEEKLEKIKIAGSEAHEFAGSKGKFFINKK